MPETNFFWDPIEDNIVQERDETGTITAEYATEPYLYGNLISQNRGGVDSQYHFDPQGSTLALTDDNQNVTDTYAYSAFGEVTEKTGSTGNPFQFIGRRGCYTGSMTATCDLRGRDYLPNVGRWLSPSLDQTGRSISTYCSQGLFLLLVGLYQENPEEPRMTIVRRRYPPPSIPPGLCAATGCDEERGIVTRFALAPVECWSTCWKEIVSEFESVHRTNMGNCCAKRNKCFVNADDRGELVGRFRDACQNAWVLWLTVNQNSLETLAAVKGCQEAGRLAAISCAEVKRIRPTTSVSCLTGKPVGPPFIYYGEMNDPVCCSISTREKELQCAHQNPSATLLCCPFKDDGDYDVECIRRLRLEYDRGRNRR